MSPDSFCYWLNGFFEISGQKKLTQQQVQIIKDHLDLVFKKVTPKYDDIGFYPSAGKIQIGSNISCSINTNNDPPIGFR